MNGILLLLGLIIIALMSMLRQCLDRIKAQANYIRLLETELRKKEGVNGRNDRIN